MGILFPGLDPDWVRNRVCYCGRHECGQESLDLQMTAGEAAKAALACGRKSASA